MLPALSVPQRAPTASTCTVHHQLVIPNAPCASTLLVLPLTCVLGASTRPTNYDIDGKRTGLRGLDKKISGMLGEPGSEDEIDDSDEELL